MDPACQSETILIPGTNNDAAMRWGLKMEPNEMSAVEGQDGTSIRCCKGKHRSIRDLLLGLAGLLGCQDIMTEKAKLFDDGVIEILVGVQAGHRRSRLLVSQNRLFDLITMRFVVGPGRFQIGQ
jgi:hypothetical protein